VRLFLGLFFWQDYFLFLSCSLLFNILFLCFYWIKLCVGWRFTFNTTTFTTTTTTTTSTTTTTLLRLLRLHFLFIFCVFLELLIFFCSFNNLLSFSASFRSSVSFPGSLILKCRPPFFFSSLLSFFQFLFSCLPQLAWVWLHYSIILLAKFLLMIAPPKKKTQKKNACKKAGF